ncbi:hypothetical protein BGX34_000934 [Mortierella sp. NVP85]|nr:hypothetical protein BGX34_000934 [Mortierella sp. NVP85]
MALTRMLPKDALTLCTVTTLFIYFAVVLWTNLTIVLPYWTPLFWAAALSVPLHALKSRLLPVLDEALENDFVSILALMIGAVVHFVLRFFLGSYIANAIKAAFLSYCHVIYLISDGRPRKKATNDAVNGELGTKGLTEYDGALDRIDGEDDDYELHPNYQTLVDQEYDKYARPPNWPSYINLLRAAFIYVLFQFTTITELRDFFKDVWIGVELGTSSQLTWLLIAVIAHIQYSCIGQVVFMIERLFYPGLSPEEQEKVSFLNIGPRVFRRAIRESLNSTLSTVLVFSTLSILGLLGVILSVGVMHDVQGLVVQTHQRVALIKEEQARQLEANFSTEYSHMPRPPMAQRVDEGLVTAYSAGIDWLDPILKEAFPDLGWSTMDWARNVADIVVDLSPSSQATSTARVVDVGTCEAEVEKETDLGELMDQYQDQKVSVQSPLADATSSPPASTADEKTEKPTPEQQETIDDLEEPELWIIPTLDTIDIYGLRNREAFGFRVQESSKQRMAINLSQARRLMNIVLGYHGFEPSAMAQGFNTFNDLLFRWILFLLGLITFTGLKVSPLQRVGWIVDQALVSSASMYGSRLSTSSPGRVLAKSLEFAISGTFIAMLKLSIYHTAFTLVWTRFLADRVTALAATEAVSPDFVPVKYAWLTSLFGIVLTLYPIAPNWLVALPGAIVHFYIYGQRHVEAIAMVIGHFLVTAMVDGAVWDTHVVKSARPGVSSAFWLGLWVFLGGLKWGTKGLLLGPVLFASIPAIWSALLELRGRPSGLVTKHGVKSRIGLAGTATTATTAVEEEEVVERKLRNGGTRRRFSRREYEEVEEEEEGDSYKKQHKRSSSSSSREIAW